MLRTRPHRSGAHDAESGKTKNVPLPTAAPVDGAALPEVVPVVVPAAPAAVPDVVAPTAAALLAEPTDACEIEGLTLTAGKYPARATSTCARAAMKFSKYCAIVWLLMSRRASSASSSGSPNISHQRPLSAASCGLAGRHVPGGSNA